MERRRLINSQSASRDHHQQTSKGGSTSSNSNNINMLQNKKLVRGSEPRRSNYNNKPQLQQLHVPDLTDFMNDMFFGTLNNTSTDHKRAYNLTGTTGHDHDGHDRDRTAENSVEESEDDDHELDDEGSSRRTSVSGRATQEWLAEARRLVAASPSSSRCESPSRPVGSPRFAAVAAQGAASPASVLDRRDPLSRSARRHRAIESFSGEIISKSTRHSRNKSETFTNNNAANIALIDSPITELSPTSAVHDWFSDTIKPSNPTPPPQPQPSAQLPPCPPTSNTTLSRRQSSFPRKSRFQQQQSAEPSSPRPQAIAAPPPPPPLRLSPPRNLVESAQRRSVSSSTCSFEKIASPKKPISSGNGSSSPELGLNAFLKWQRTKLQDGDAKARIVLSGPSNSTSSMVAAICYAWLLEKRARKESKKGEEECVVVPVMNVKRATMWKLREASWLFYHVGLDVASLLFADEVDLEGLMMEGKLSMLVIGQDVLGTNGEVSSQCTILTDNYCEEAYDLLQTPMLKKLLLAAILLDTQNLNFSSQLSMTRDAEAVQLLLVGSKPNYRNALFDQLTQDQRDDSFLEALRQSYGKPPNEKGHETKEHVDRRVAERKSPSISHHEATSKTSDKKSNDAKSVKTNKVSPKSEKPNSLLPQGPSVPPAKVSPTPDASRGKNKFFLAKWFGFGSK